MLLDIEDNNCTGLIKMLSILLSAEMEVEDKRHRLRDEFDLAMTKEMEKEMISMCDYGRMVATKNREEGIKAGKAQGLMEGILSSIKNLMETSNMNATQAMNALKVPESDRAMYAAQLNK